MIGGVVVNRINYFEVLEASPEWDERQIANHVRSYNKVEAHIKQEALRKLINPLDRFQYELTTFHRPDYNALTTESVMYCDFLHFLTGIPVLSWLISPCLTHYLYSGFVNHSLFKSLEKDSYANQSIYVRIREDLLRDSWMLHSIALLLERYAEYYREIGDLQNSAKLTVMSSEYWISLFERSDIYKETYTFAKLSGTPKEAMCLQVWDNMKRRLLDDIYEQFKQHMDRADTEKAFMNYSAIKNMSDKNLLRDAAVSLMDKMLSDFIKYIDGMFLRGRVKTGFSGDYEAIFKCLDKLYGSIGNIERLLLYETEKTASQLFELKTSKSFDNAWKRLPEIKSLVRRLESIKPGSSQSFIIEQQMKSMYDTLQDLAVECANSGKYRMSVEFFRTLPYDRKIPVGQDEKKTIDEIVKMVENLAIINGDFWSPNVGGGPNTTTQLPQNYYGSGKYAGFWRRVFALAIDCLILWLAINIIISPVFPRLDVKDSVFWTMFIYWLYFSKMESSGFQGTIGKKILGIKVTNLNGGRITFGNATGRFLSRAVSGIILGIGFLMAGTTQNKQALHDIMAGTLVVKN